MENMAKKCISTKVHVYEAFYLFAYRKQRTGRSVPVFSVLVIVLSHSARDSQEKEALNEN
jgi:hypothetical protein